MITYTQIDADTVKKTTTTEEFISTKALNDRITAIDGELLAAKALPDTITVQNPEKQFLMVRLAAEKQSIQNQLNEMK